MTYMQAFEKIKEKLAGADTSAFTGDFAVQVNLVNKDCAGAFYIAYRSGVFEVEPYDYIDNNAMVDLMYGDFTKLIEGKLDPEKAAAEGKIQVRGELDKVALLKALVKKAPAARKAPAKPKTEKKVEAMPSPKPAVRKSAAVAVKEEAKLPVKKAAKTEPKTTRKPAAKKTEK